MIEVKFFAELRELLQCSLVQLEASPGLDAYTVWSRATNNAAIPLNTQCAINRQHANMQQSVQDGDEVAFFPPVTGG